MTPVAQQATSASHRLRAVAALAALLVAASALWLWALPRRDAVRATPRPDAAPAFASDAPVLRAARHVYGAAPLVSGSVRETSGQPIAGASVCASCAYPECGEAGPPHLSCATTASDGSYALDALSIGVRYRMLAAATDHRPAAPLERGEPNPWLTLSEALPRRIDFVLEAGGARVAGRVVDVYGGPVAGAFVAAAEEQGGVGSATVSDEDGRFALPLAAGVWNVRASAQGYDSSSALLGAPSDGAELVLSPASSVEGRVLRASDGVPVPDLEVRATKHARMALGPGDGSAMTDAQGSFVLDTLGTGDYELVVRGPRWYGSLPGRLHLAIGEHAKSIEIRVAPALTVEAQVLLDPEGAPCPTGRVALVSATVTNALGEGFATLAPIERGAVVIPGVPAGEYRVEVTCPGYLPRAEYERVRVEAADVRGLRWPITRGLRVVGRLVDARGRGVGTRVVSATPDETLSVGYAQTVTSAEGMFELPALAAARYRIAAEDAPESAQDIDLRGGRPLSSPLRLTVQTTGTIDVQVTPAAAAATAVVQAISSDTQRAALRVGADRLELRDVPAGTYRVYASDGRNPPLEQPVNVDEGARAFVSFALPSSSGVLRGQVLDQRGVPVADAQVTAVPSRVPALPGPELRSAVLTRADGSFVIPNLIAGENYNVQAEHHGDGSAAVLDAVAGGTIVLRLSESS
jgi:protocatechuate 3,4-dioxygenase beta subunit